ncbi:hypothetical protein DdX_16454 [Ditylenchus destructor]|uniref:Uncharacterized protein n=1 Tax=Ditylenchus destructor TaxID=166010 RepID=A0AAD4MNF3_9BILA|nr:hypothetical protein DdX_16454 [Ditylenchus destructor]
MLYLLSLLVVLHQIRAETFVKQIGTGRCVWCVDRNCIKEYKIYVDKTVSSGEPPAYFYEKVEYVKNRRTGVSEPKVIGYNVPEDKFYRGCPANGVVCSSLDRKDCIRESVKALPKDAVVKAQTNVIVQGGQCMWCRDSHCDPRSLRYIYVDQSAPPEFFYETTVEVTDARTRKPARKIREVPISNDQMYLGCPPDGYVCSSVDRDNCDVLMRGR